ncbi:hypothetical protein BKA63DRAFT_556752 [Paraphoma chrysanthemicola]|nr:hypothetical protein BKA63DRAFT_556752 [Paraphoma chrysanthemicola]
MIRRIATHHHHEPDSESQQLRPHETTNPAKQHPSTGHTSPTPTTQLALTSASVGLAAVLLYTTVSAWSVESVGCRIEAMFGTVVGLPSTLHRRLDHPFAATFALKRLHYIIHIVLPCAYFIRSLNSPLSFAEKSSPEVPPKVVRLDGIEYATASPNQLKPPKGSSSGSTTPRKSVRFNIDGVEVSADDESNILTSPADPPTSPTTKKSVRFDVHGTLGRNHTNTSTSSSNFDTPSATGTTLLDADTSLLTPLGHSEVDLSSTTSQTSGRTSTTTDPTISELSISEIKTWTQTGTFITSPIPSTTSVEHRNTPQTNTTTPSPESSQHIYSPSPSSPSKTANPSSKAPSIDEGETNSTGRVILADTQPCEKCGGKVVWATKGEWLLVCGGCGEPQ